VNVASVHALVPESPFARTRQWIEPPGSCRFGVARRLAVVVDHSNGLYESELETWTS
jgi:hypothetical protein